MELADRLRFLIKKLELSSTSFADEIGVQRSSISHVISGRNKPSLEFVQKIFRRFPDTDIQWLVTGIKSESDSGEKVQEQNNELLKSEEENNSTTASKKISRIVMFYSDHSFDEYYPNQNEK